MENYEKHQKIKFYLAILCFFISLKTMKPYLNFLLDNGIFYQWSGPFKIRYFFIKLLFLLFIYGGYILFWISLPYLIDKILIQFNPERKAVAKAKKKELREQIELEENLQREKRERERRKRKLEDEREAKELGITVSELINMRIKAREEKERLEEERKYAEKAEKRFRKHIKKLHKKGYHTEALLMEQNREIEKLRKSIEEKNNG